MHLSVFQANTIILGGQKNDKQEQTDNDTCFNQQRKTVVGFDIFKIN
jgi:hypothetical protein